MGISRQEYWSGLPFPSPGDLPKPGVKPRSPVLQAVSILLELPGIMSLANRQFYFFLSDFETFISSSCLTALARTFRTMLNTSVQSRHFMGKLLVFHH